MRFLIPSLLILTIATTGCTTVERTVIGRLTVEGEPASGANVWRERGDCGAVPDRAAVTDEGGRFRLVLRDATSPLTAALGAEGWWIENYCFLVGGRQYGPQSSQGWAGLDWTLLVDIPDRDSSVVTLLPAR